MPVGSVVGTKIISFSLHNVDEVLGDLDLNIKARVRASHWLVHNA